MNKSVLFFLMLFCIISCSKPLKNKQELLDYIKEPKHGLKIEQDINKINATITFRPWQLVAANLTGNKTILTNIKSKFYFVFSLSANGKELLRQLPYNQYSEMVQVLAFRMQPLISIILDGNKAIDAEDCMFQQTYGMAKENEILLIFNKAKLENAKILNIKIKEFGLSTGTMDFQINMSDIKNIPKINF